ncbi:hypothetical protein VPIG_00158 [Vibrio phage PWH3a-P1]|uniref:hypothetical protein n=1 Tax=Vibrio phage PWH3a-P1 TaxID=754058 RepID=UPI0002C0DAF3|nr:hypothetical protein VPIG_00158 [Vibrio phage PWH3a-P1]AGH32015.1 hypothetical protein VPIG_00158 [Vibrio phage PWH3a-P1]
MKTKFELKMKMKQLERQIDDVKMREKSFYNAQKLWQLGIKAAKGATNQTITKKLYTRMEDSRSIWWKSIDKKLELEQTIKVLEKKVVEDLMKGIK